MAIIEFMTDTQEIANIKRAASAFKSHELYVAAINVAARYEVEAGDKYRYEMTDEAELHCANMIAFAIQDVIAEVWNTDPECVEEDVLAATDLIYERRSQWK